MTELDGICKTNVHPHCLKGVVYCKCTTDAFHHTHSRDFFEAGYLKITVCDIDHNVSHTK